MPHIQTQTEWEAQMSEKILNFISRELYFELRYLKPALSAFVCRRVDGLLTFATDGIYLYYSVEPLLRIFKKNALFLDRAYLHLTLHCIFRHPWFLGSREVWLWNTACDIVTEFTIDSMEKSCTKRILSLIRKDTYASLQQENRGISAAVVYRWLKGKTKEQIQELSAEFYTDDHRFWPRKEEQNSPAFLQAKQNWDKRARQVTLEQSQRGEESKNGEALFIAQINAAKKRQDYKTFLQKFAVFWEEPCLDLEEFELGYYAYGLKLYGNLPLIEPLETKESHKIREFIIAIDTSYSTSGGLVKGFLEQTFSVLSHKNSFFQQYQIRIIQCDSRILRDDVIKNESDFLRFAAELKVEGGGGTDFRPVFSYIETMRMKKKMKKPDGLLYFTDGKGIYPGKKPDYKTAFLFLEDYDETAVPPWAMRLRLEPEEFIHEY